MKLVALISIFIFPLISSGQKTSVTKQGFYLPTERVANDFRKLLERPVVDFKPSFTFVKTDSVIIERGFIYSEVTEKVPILIYKPTQTTSKSFPVVICLHGTGGNKEDESIKSMLYQLTKMGIMGVAIDARFHGERITGGANGSQEYVDAIIKAWKADNSEKHSYPFYYDTVYDLWRLTDYLVTRRDVQSARIGMMGISMGGIETWMAASVDKRIKVTVPVIAVQSFKWSLENDKWQGRARTIWKAHEQAAKDLGDSTVNKTSVKLLWDRLLPGITNEFDCPSMIRLFVPRPLLLLNNEKDENCPLGGAQIAFATATKAYRSKNRMDRLKINVTPKAPHRFLPHHVEMTLAWFKKWL